MNNIFGTGPFMQVVNVLSNDDHIIFSLKFFECIMGCVGFCFAYIFPPLIVKFQDQFPVPGPALWRGNFVNIISFPQSVRIPESRNATFSADTCPGEDDNFLFRVHLSRVMLVWFVNLVFWISISEVIPAIS